MTLSPQLQADLVAGMRALTELLCYHPTGRRGDTKEKREWDIQRAWEHAIKILARVDAEIAAKGASDE